MAGEDRPVGVAHLLAALGRGRRRGDCRLVRQGQIDIGTAPRGPARGGPGLEAALERPPDGRPPGRAGPLPTPTLDRFGRDLTALARRASSGRSSGGAARSWPCPDARPRQRTTWSSWASPGWARPRSSRRSRSAPRRAGPGRPRGQAHRGAGVGPLPAAGSRGPRGEGQGVIAEARAHPEIILFIDELHAPCSAAWLDGAAARPGSCAASAP